MSCVNGHLPWLLIEVGDSHPSRLRVNQPKEGKLKGSLAVERAEMLAIIGHLESVIEGLQDVNAEVSQYADELHRLREQVLQTQSPKKWRTVVDVGCDVIVRIAVEMLKTWL